LVDVVYAGGEVTRIPDRGTQHFNPKQSQNETKIKPRNKKIKEGKGNQKWPGKKAAKSQRTPRGGAFLGGGEEFDPKRISKNGQNRQSQSNVHKQLSDGAQGTKPKNWFKKVPQPKQTNIKRKRPLDTIRSHGKKTGRGNKNSTRTSKKGGGESSQLKKGGLGATGDPDRRNKHKLSKNEMGTKKATKSGK